MSDVHEYRITIVWTGNSGTGTTGYRDYSRDFALKAEGKHAIEGSSDAAFRGTRSRWNPEEMLVAALSACHKLSYLHLCAINGVVVTAYEDRAEGFMRFDAESGSGHFEHVTLHPAVRITAESNPGRAAQLHHEAHRVCFIANSVNFPVECEPVTSRENEGEPEITTSGR